MSEIADYNSINVVAPLTKKPSCTLAMYEINAGENLFSHLLLNNMPVLVIE